MSSGDPPTPLRFAFLLTQLSSYLSACLEQLAALPGVSVSVICVQPAANAPFDPDEVAPRRAVVHRHPSLPTGPRVLQDVAGFDADVLVISGWQTAAFRHVARRVPKSTLRVLLMDNQWLATPKQMLGVLTSPLYVRPLFDVAFLPGERQAVFARKLGFSHQSIWRGMNTCNHPAFAQAPASTSSSSPSGTAAEPGFLFVGRLVPEKGLDVLAEGYTSYRANCRRPWPLQVCGTGPLESLLSGIAGVTTKGFVQPRDLPYVYSNARCLVMPSLFEPWGVAVHEATAAGLPVICSTACGAAPHLVEDGVNGYLVEPGNAADLAEAMIKCSEMSPAERDDMSRMSRILSCRYTPALWAALVRKRSLESVAALRRSAGLQ